MPVDVGQFGKRKSPTRNEHNTGSHSGNHTAVGHVRCGVVSIARSLSLSLPILGKPIVLGHPVVLLAGL